MKITKVSIDRPVGLSMFFLAVGVLGLISLGKLSVDLLPDISTHRFSVVTRFSGISAEEIENLVTKPLEASISRIPGIRRVESISKEGFSCLTLEFAWGGDLDFTMLHTREALDDARANLPEGADKPTIIRFDPQSKPIMVLAVSGESGLLELEEFAEEMIKPRLEQIDGIGSADITGGIEREIHVDVSPQLLALYRLTIDEVAAKIDAFNQSIEGGTIQKDMSKYAIRVTGEFESLSELGEISLKTTKERSVIRLKDIAQVKNGIKERQGLTRLDAKESIGLLVRKEYGANTVKVTKLVKKVIDQIRREAPEIKITLVSEQAAYIESAIKAVRNEIVQGAILVFLVVLIFLQEFRSPFIINLVIPISVLATFNLLYFCNIGINIMSLGGLALGVGMLDDCADVISENIFRHRSLGKSAIEAAFLGTKEVGGAVAGTALTTIAVFLPIIYVHGVAGQLFRDACLTVTFSLAASLLVALSLLPMLQAREVGPKSAAAMLGSGPGSARLGLAVARTKPRLLARAFRYLTYPFKTILFLVFRAFNSLYGPFVIRYREWLVWSLDHKSIIAVASLIFFAVSFFIGSRLSREQLPAIQSTSFELRLRTPVEYSLEQTANIGLSLEEHLRMMKPVKGTFSQTGIVSGMERLDADLSLNSVQIFVEVEKPAQLEPTLGYLRRKLSQMPSLSYSIVKEQSTWAEFLAFPAAEIGLKVKGDDLGRIKEIAEELVRRLRGVKGIIDLDTNIGEGKPELRIQIQKGALARYAGLSPRIIGGFLVNMVRGKVATQFNDREKKYDILVRPEESSRADIESLLNAQLPHQGILIPLRDLVTVERAKGPREIRREDQQREIVVTANLRGRKISQVIPAINEKIKQIRLPENTRIVWSGEREEMNASFKSLFRAQILAVLLTYMIMAAQFESLLHPFLVMLTLPMGAAGACVSLYLTGQTLNVISMIGMVVLVGLVVDDAIVEIDYINRLRRSGKPLRDAVVEGCMTRLRAILMASLDTVFGLIPMAIAVERGSELLRPLGIAVAGGLLFSTFLTLIQIPVVYEWVERKRES